MELVGTLDNLEMADVKKRLLSLREKYVARRVASTMILNAWRQRRRDVAAQKQSTEDLLEQVSILKDVVTVCNSLMLCTSKGKTSAAPDEFSAQSKGERECQKD